MMPMMMHPAAMAGYEKGYEKGYGKGGSCKGGGGKGDGKAEDWICANCGDLQFGRNSVCRMCNTPKTARPTEVSKNGIEPREGDWTCPNCGDLQFARNEVCRKCSTPKPAVRGGGARAAAPRGRAAGKGGGGEKEMRPG